MSADAVHSGGTLGEMLIQAIQRFPERTALIDDRGTLSYRALGRRIGQTMAALSALGLQRGAGIAQLAGNRSEMFIVMAAAYLMGLRSVTLHSMGGLQDHAHILRDADITVFIAGQDYAERLRALRAECATVSHWYAHDEGLDAASFWAYVDGFDAAPPQLLCGPDDIVRLAYTGGTTGWPKGVMLSNRSLWMQALLILAARELPSELRLLCPTPISHGAGAMLVPTLWRGGTVILQQRFDAGRFITALTEHKATAAYLVPTMIYAVLDHPLAQTADFSCLRLLSYGASPMSPSRLAEALQVFGPVLVQSYGQTECPSNILCLTQHDHLREDVRTLGAAGMPYPGVTVALLDESGVPVAEGEIGEVCVRSPLVMAGYWKQPELTAEVFRHGWLHTGDMAYRDSHGYYFLVDRKKDMIISGGFNVYPKEIEDVLSTHPAVAAAAVIGVPDEKWGEAVKAVVAVRAGAVVTAQELQALVRAAKGPVHMPKTVDFVDAIPLTALGKFDKSRLRQDYWGGRQRAVN